ncbi:MAG: prolyl oligopeptidase family serine peptidase [Phycisphaerales bacterium JB043]
MHRVICALLICLFSTSLHAQVTLEQIMQHPDWIGNGPRQAFWSDDGSSLYYWKKRVGSEISDLYRLSLDGQSEMVEASDHAQAGASGGDWSSDRTRRVFAREGDLYLRDLSTGTLRQLTRTSARESSPFFLRGEFAIAFTRGDDVLVRDLTSGLEYQPFDVRAQDDPAKKKDEKYIQEQQDRLFEIVRLREQRQRERREHTDATRTDDPSRVDPAWYLGKKHRVSGRYLSPDGERLVVRLAPKKPKEGKPDNMPEWVTDSGYVVNKEVRALVGTTPAPDNSLVLLEGKTRQKHEVALDDLPMIDDDPLADLRKAAKEREKEADEESDTSKDDSSEEVVEPEATEKPQKKSKPRSVSIFNVEWNDAGTHFAFQARSHDNKDRWTCVYDTSSHELAVVEHLRFVDGWINWAFNNLGWLPDTSTLWFLSEASGYSHLYTWNAESQTTNQLTSGSFEVRSVTELSDAARVVVLANREHPGIREVYTIDTQTGSMTQITSMRGIIGPPRGGQSVALSPDESTIAFVYSSLTRPNELYVQDLDPDATARQLTSSRTEEFSSIEWVTPQIVSIASSHQDDPIYGRLYLPDENAPGAGPDGKRPVVCFVHGAGYMQNVHFGWSSYFREFMFHTLLTQHGYIVLDLDYRASAGYGAAWRQGIYRRMGTPELEDYLDGIDWLVANHNADPERVGIYGGSYGGFMAFMALFKAPESFAAGAALRPVTDWAHYNNGYTSNILNTPEVDPEAYERSSPIELAEGLEDPLLICHGMLDDNVFFKDSVRLVQRLIELEKEDWELAVYPIEPHGFREPSSWLDEYRRIFKLFETHLK